MQSGLPANYVFCALKVNDNEMWVGTSNGLCYYNGAWTIFNSSNSGLPLNAISAIEFDENGIMWIGTAGGGIVKYDGANWITFNSDNADLPSSNRVTNIGVINANEIWASFTSAGKSDPGGTAYYDGSQWIGYVSVPSDLVLNISIQNPDLIWFCNAENGLTKYENGSWHTYLTSNSRIPSNRIFGVAIDQNGNKWIATYGGGLSKYKGN
jgi:ligand-binding sensor domain-containing protein